MAQQPPIPPLQPALHVRQEGPGDLTRTVDVPKGMTPQQVLAEIQADPGKYGMAANDPSLRIEQQPIGGSLLRTKPVIRGFRASPNAQG